MENKDKPSSPAIWGALQEAQKELASQGIGKNSKNQGQGYYFRGIDDIYFYVVQVLNRHNLVVIPGCLDHKTEARTTTKGGAINHAFVRMSYKVVCTLDGSSVDMSMSGEGADSGDKATNKASSSAYKYAMFQLFCIPTEAVDSEIDNPDMAAPSGKAPNKPAKAPKTAESVKSEPEAGPKPIRDEQRLFLEEVDDPEDKERIRAALEYYKQESIEFLNSNQAATIIKKIRDARDARADKQPF